MLEGVAGARIAYQEAFALLNNKEEGLWLGDITFMVEHFPELLAEYNILIKKMGDSKFNLDKDGWNENSKLVLNELERLNELYYSLQKELQDIKEKLIKNDIDDLKVWKKEIDNVVSPGQIKELKKEVEDLKIFKTRSIVLFAVIQFAIAIIIGLKDKIFHAF